MATSSSCTCFTPLLIHNKSQNSHKNGVQFCSFLGKSSDHLHLQRKTSSKGSNKGFVVRNASPEAAAGDLLSSFPLPTIPGFSDNPWITAIAGLLVAGPFLIQKLLTLTKEIDTAAQTVEKIADAVGKVAEEVDKAAEDMAEALPEGGLKKVVSFVEDLAEETTKEAQRVEDLMDKVEELDDKLEAFLEKQSKGTEKA